MTRRLSFGLPVQYTVAMMPAPKAALQSDYSATIQHSFGLDLIRAVAVLMVMVSHWSNNIGYWFHVQAPHAVFFAGDVGVQLFFALSGFLIGRILIDIARTDPSWRNFCVFMVRRAMRTLPLYFVWLTVLFCVWPPSRHALADAVRFATLTQNLARPMPPDYYFAVSWSLTVEEWFYLLFGSALILLTSRLASRLQALALCLASFVLVPLVLRVWLFDWSDITWEMAKEVIFRIDEIAYGVFMAWMWGQRSWLYRYPVATLLCGVALISLCWTGYWPVPARLIPALGFNVVIIGCCLCLPAALRVQSVPKLIAWPIRWVGSRSYALYIVHLTVLVNFVQGDLLWSKRVTATVAAVIAVALPFIVAECSFRWLESPIMRRRPRQARAAAQTA